MIRKCVVLLVALLAVVQLTACGDILIQAGHENDTTETTGVVHLPEKTGNVLPAATGIDASKPVKGGVKAADEVDFPNSLSYALPEGLAGGEFDVFLGMGGGIPLLNNEGTMCGCIELHLYGSGIFEDGKLVSVTQFENHAWFASEFTPVSSGAPCVAVKYSQDVYDDKTSHYIGERDLWYAFWAKEGFEPVYAIYLYADSYDYEDLIAIAESVTFSEDAFVAQ